MGARVGSWHSPWLRPVHVSSCPMSRSPCGLSWVSRNLLLYCHFQEPNTLLTTAATSDKESLERLPPSYLRFCIIDQFLPVSSLLPSSRITTALSAPARSTTYTLFLDKRYQSQLTTTRGVIKSEEAHIVPIKNDKRVYVDWQGKI